MDTELAYINTEMLAERELMYRRVEQAVSDYRGHFLQPETLREQAQHAVSNSICEDCHKPVWQCALTWINDDECYMICEMMHIDHSAMLTAIGAQNDSIQS